MPSAARWWARSLFQLTYDLLLYDLTSTYFEGLAEENDLAQRGYSRDHRSDCKQIVLALVVTREGFPLAHLLKELCRAEGLRELRLRGTGITDAGLKHVAGMKGLRTLDLSSTKATAAGIKGLAGLEGQTELNLYGLSLKDEGLKELAAFKALKLLHIGNTGITEKGVTELKKALPECQINY